MGLMDKALGAIGIEIERTEPESAPPAARTSTPPTATVNATTAAPVAPAAPSDEVTEAEASNAMATALGLAGRWVTMTNGWVNIDNGWVNIDRVQLP